MRLGLVMSVGETRDLVGTGDRCRLLIWEHTFSVLSVNATYLRAG